jgi:hypothetical protein
MYRYKGTVDRSLALVTNEADFDLEPPKPRASFPERRGALCDQ